MRIDVIEEGKRAFSFPIPERLVLNGFFASIIPVFVNGRLEKHGIKLKGKLLRKIVKEYYRTKNDLEKDFEFITVDSKNGDSIKIVL